MPLFKHELTLDEETERSEQLKAKNERMGIEVSIAQKKVAIAALKRMGLKPSDFGKPSAPSTWSRIWGFLKGDSLGVTKLFKRH